MKTQTYTMDGPRITTNPNPYLLNIPELQNVQQSASGLDRVTTLQTRVDQISQMVNFNDKQIATNTIKAYSGNTITFLNDVNVSSNATITGTTVAGLSAAPNFSVLYKNTTGGVSGASSFFFSTGTNEVVIDGKLTVTGLIDPIGLALTPQSSHPLPPSNPYYDTTLWYSSANNTVNMGASTIVRVSPGATGIPVKSARVNAGVDVALDDISVQMPVAGNRSLILKSSVSGFTGDCSGHATYFAGVDQFSHFVLTGQTYTTAFQYLNAAWTFGQGDTAIYHLHDTTNGRCYRITLIVGSGYNNNIITLERLY